jgi:hypothetical protein
MLELYFATRLTEITADALLHNTGIVKKAHRMKIKALFKKVSPFQDPYSLSTDAI